MTTPGWPSQGAGRAGARIVALTSAFVALALAFAFFGLSIMRMPFAAIAAAGIAAAALYGHLMWRVFAARRGGPSLSGALVAGAGGPLVGAFVLDVLQSVQAGLGGSVLLAFLPVTVIAVIAGAGGGLLALVARRLKRGE